MRPEIFDIAFQYDGRKYSGWVSPSGEMNKEKKPVSFHAVLNGVSFGYLSYKHCHWHISEQRPAELVKKVGEAIEAHYRLAEAV